MDEDFMLDSPMDFNAINSFTPTVSPNVTIDAETQREAARYSVGADYGFGSKALAAIGGAVPDLVDTVSSSIGFTERGEINEAMLSAIGSPGLRTFYEANRGAVQVGSGIAAVIAADYAAGRFLRPAGAAMNLVRRVPYVSRIASLDRQYQQSMRLIQASSQRMARSGMMGIEQYTGQMTVARLGQNALTTTPGQLRSAFLTRAVKRGLARNVVTEGFLVAGANQNEFLFSDDLSENLMWMAGGLAIGGMIDRFMGVHTLKRMANSDIISREFAHAYDPAGTEAQRMRAALHDADGTLESVSSFGYLQGHFTDAATSYKLSADEGRNVNLSPNDAKTGLLSRRTRLATQQDEEVRNLLNKATSQGIGEVPGSRFAMKSQGYGNGIDFAMHRDPTAMYGVEEIGAAGVDMTLSGVSQQRFAGIRRRMDEIFQVMQDGGVRVKSKSKDGKVTERIRALNPKEQEAFRAEYRQLVFRNSLTEMHLVDGEWVPKQIGYMMDEFQEPNIIRESSDDLTIWQAEARDGGNIGISNDLELFLPQGKKLGALNLQDTMSLWRAGNQALNWFESQQKKMVLPRKPEWFHLDMAEEYIRRTGNEDLVQFPAGLSRETAQVESFKMKVKALKGSKALQNSEVPQAQMARYRFNLPRLNSYEAGLMGTEEHPLEVLLRGAQDWDLESITYRDLMDGLRDVRHINGMTALAKDRGDQLQGNMFTFMLDDSGKPMRPLIAYKRQFAPFEWTKENLADQMAARKLYFRKTLTAPNAGRMSREITDGLLNDPDFVAASQVTGLQDSQIMSMLPGFTGAAPQTARGRVLNDVVSKEWRDRDNPVLLAAARLRDKVDRQARAIMQGRIESSMGDVITRINGPRNARSRSLVNQFLSFRQGWDLKSRTSNGIEIAQTVSGQLPNGQRVTKYLLDEKSIANQRRFKNTYGRELAEGDVLMTPRGDEVGLDDLALEFMERFQKLTRDINVEKNTLNRAMGLGKINTAPMYAPAPSTKGKYIGFTLDIENKVIPNGTIIASTQEEFGRMRAALEDASNKDSPLNRPGARFFTQDEVTDFNTLWDNAQMNMLDPGMTAIQPNRRSKGALAGFEINEQALDDALTWARDSYLRHGHDVMTNILKDQIIAAQTRAQIARESRRNAMGSSEAKSRSVYDYYIESVMGRMSGSSDASLVGQMTRPLEDWLNDALRGAKPVLSRTFKGAMEFARAVRPWDPDKKHRQAFDQLVKELGPHMPYKSATEYIQAQHQIKPPKELGEITGMTSRFEATMRLRMFEVIHPLMNLSGIINAMPAVVRSFQRVGSESEQDFARRVGHLAQTFHFDNGKSIGIFDMPRLIHQTFKKAWSRESHVDWKYMQSHGYVTQEVAEFQRQFGAIKSRDGWKAFMFGDPNSTSEVAKKGLIGWVSVLADRSEDFSRSWGHMVGLELADSLGIVGREARHSFAHDVANKMIANYNPANRPAIFQGALGAPIGLFQSFIWNFYQRMFRYIETGDARSAATQYASQSALFGITTVPGFSVINALFFKESNGENSPADAIYERFGDSAGDLLFGGVLGNLPKLINILPGEQGFDGVNLYSRGDTAVRMPGFNPPPIFDSIARVKDGIRQGFQAFWLNNPDLTSNQVAEIASNMLTNRPMAGFIETFFADGYDTDATGQVATESQTLMEDTARVLGVRSMRQAKELEAFYSNKNAMTIQRARMSDLNQSARAAIRAGNTQGLPGYFNEYVERGGDPRRFNQWMRRNMEAALESRGERQLDDFSSNPAKAQLMERLLDFGVSVDESVSDEVPTANPYDANPTPVDSTIVSPVQMVEPGYNDSVMGGVPF